MAENEQTKEKLDPLSVLAADQAALKAQLDSLSKTIESQNAQMVQLMQSNAALLAQNSALINQSQPAVLKEKSAQDLAMDEMMKLIKDMEKR